jgi:hypothetical protein
MREVTVFGKLGLPSGVGWKISVGGEGSGKSFRVETATSKIITEIDTTSIRHFYDGATNGKVHNLL